MHLRLKERALLATTPLPTRYAARLPPICHLAIVGLRRLLSGLLDIPISTPTSSRKTGYGLLAINGDMNCSSLIAQGFLLLPWSMSKPWGCVTNKHVRILWRTTDYDGGINVGARRGGSKVLCHPPTSRFCDNQLMENRAAQVHLDRNTALNSRIYVKYGDNIRPLELKSLSVKRSGELM